MIARTGRRLAIVVAGALLLGGGCASTPTASDDLKSAREAYQSVEQDPDVARSAAEPLDRSRRALDEAERLLSEGAEMDRVNHHAYLSERYAEIAREEAEQARLQREVEKARERRQQVRLEMEQRKAQSLEQRLSDLQARETERGVVLTLGDVLFDFNEASLKPGGERAAARLARFLREYPERRIRVEGHTDSVGSASYNRRLSERRAEAVKQAIVGRGIEPSRIVTEGYGEQYPVASNDNEAGRQRNRRVEVVISDRQGDVEAR
jgi:outer membrane protein OmpA-like peptidoglycan-associated protein